MKAVRRRPTDLEQLPRVAWTGSVVVELELEGLSDADRVHWQKRIERYRNACGCEMGATTLLAALCVCIAYGVLVGARTVLERPLRALGLVIAFCLWRPSRASSRASWLPESP
jgi:hypothetical protein